MNTPLLRWIALGLLLMIAAAAAGQKPVVIEGDAPFAKNEEIRLVVFEDLFNRIPETVDACTIDADGHFRLQYAATAIRPAQLAIRTTKAELFIVPSRNYNFHVSADTALFGFVNPERFGGFLHVTTDKTDTADLNYKINRFDRYFNELMDRYGFRLVYDRDKTTYDTVMLLLNKAFDVHYDADNFYSSYVYYTCGLLDRLCFPKDRQAVFERFFDHDVLYDNPAYMLLFNNFYSGYLYNSRYVPKELLNTAINDKPDYTALFSGLGRDPMLRSDRVRELAVIRNVIDLYGNEEFDGANLLEILRSIRQETRFPEHALYAENALRLLAPDPKESAACVWKDENGEEVRFGQFGDGKDVFVQVFQSDCVDCIREMKMLEELNRRFGDRVQFVSLDVDMDPDKYRRFCQKYKARFSWPIWHFNGNYDWLQSEHIETLPNYLLLDSAGQILNRDLPSPGNGLIDYFYLRYPQEEQQDNNPLFRTNKKEQ